MHPALSSHYFSPHPPLVKQTLVVPQTALVALQASQAAESPVVLQNGFNVLQSSFTVHVVGAVPQLPSDKHTFGEVHYESK